MTLHHVHLLQIQRDLHDIPRGMERFNAYLRTMSNDAGDDVRYPPLVFLNPMGREHVAARLDEWIALGGETIAADALQEAASRLPSFPHDFQHGLGIADDVMGGWTNRYSSDASMRFERSALKRRWMASLLWVSETPSAEHMRQLVFQTVYRSWYLLEHGQPNTLRQIMAQEGGAAHFAGYLPHLDSDDIAYSREVLQPHLDSSDYPICFVGMYGDAAANVLGYPPMGLSERAGFAVALADAIEANR